MNAAGASYLVFTAGGMSCAIAVSSLREVARDLPFAPVPGVPYGIAGVVNLRGHVLPAIDIACLLGLPAAPRAGMNIIAATGGTFYSLVAEHCGNVVTLAPENLEPLPAAAPQWHLLAHRICRHEGRIMPVVDIEWLVEKIGAAAQGQGNVP